MVKKEADKSTKKSTTKKTAIKDTKTTSKKKKVEEATVEEVKEEKPKKVTTKKASTKKKEEIKVEPVVVEEKPKKAKTSKAKKVEEPVKTPNPFSDFYELSGSTIRETLQSWKKAEPKVETVVVEEEPKKAKTSKAKKVKEPVNAPEPVEEVKVEAPVNEKPKRTRKSTKKDANPKVEEVKVEAPKEEKPIKEPKKPAKKTTRSKAKKVEAVPADGVTVVKEVKGNEGDLVETFDIVERAGEEPSLSQQLKAIRERRNAVAAQQLSPSQNTKMLLREALAVTDDPFKDVCVVCPITFDGKTVDENDGKIIATFRKSIIKTDAMDFLNPIVMAIHNRLPNFDATIILANITIKNITINKFEVRI